MSLRIKVPPSRPSTSGAPQEMEHEQLPLKRKRKATTRYVQSNSEDEDDNAGGSAAGTVHKVQRTSTKDRPKARRQSTTHSDVGTKHDVENDIDIENEGGEGSQAGQEREQDYLDDHRSEHSVQRSTVSGQDMTSTSTRLKMRPHAEPVAQRRSMARKVVVSDDEEEEYMESVHDPIPEPEEDDDDDYVSMDERPTPKSKGKGKATSGKGATATKGTKRKAKADPEDGLASTLEKKGSAKGSAAAKKRMKPTLRIDDSLIDVVGDSVPTPEASATVEMSSPATGKQDSPAPTAVPQPKKTKLPTIKKNKLPGTPNVGTPTSATSTSKKPLLELGLPSKINHDDVRKNMIGKTDIDLSNKSVYQELFLKTGSGDGNTPRRAKEEERRKELNRMREEAKAKRAAEARHSFNLQAQFDKIQLFEEKLKAIKSSAIYPNFLASKFRQVYDIDRMKQMSREANNQTPQNDKEPEEGEVS